MNAFESIFNHWTFLFLNLVIIMVVEATGTYFMDTGMIHLIALVFIGLGVGRIFVHYDVYDRFLKPLMYGSIATLILFALSHILEYASYFYFSFPYDTVAANVVNMYLAGLLIIMLSTSYFLKRIAKEFQFYDNVLLGGIVACLLATVLFSFRPGLVQINAASPPMYAYVGLIVIVTSLGVRWLAQLKRHVSILSNFIDYFNASFIMIAASSVFYIVNDPLEKLGVPFMQVMYIGHFLFYGALSLMFLAFSRLAHLGGVYETLEKKSPRV